MPQKVRGFLCPVCCQAGDHLRRSRHHIVPRWVTADHRAVNLDEICRPCHDQVEAVYDQFMDLLLPDQLNAFKEANRKWTAARRLVAQVDKAIELERNDIVDLELAAGLGLDHVPPLFVARELTRDWEIQKHLTKETLRLAMAELPWHRLYHIAKLIIRGHLTLDRLIRKEMLVS